MTRVLVTGATTAVGSSLILRLLSASTCESILAVGIDEPPPELPRVEAGRFEYERCDLTKSRQVRNLLFGPAKSLGIDTIIHSALHQSARDVGSQVHAQNVGSTRELLFLAERHPSMRRFIYRSYSDVYRIEPARPVLVSEDHPLELGADSPQRVRNRVEADLTVCARMGMSRLRICVLRCSEILAEDSGSQLYDYLRSAVCFRPLGFDPMLNLLSLADAAQALNLATQVEADGIFNIPGKDTLPLSLAIRKWGRLGIAIPGPLMAPLYGLRALTLGTEFRYDMNRRRLHVSSVLDGSRARQILGYQPEAALSWPGDRARRTRRAGQSLLGGEP